MFIESERDTLAVLTDLCDTIYEAETRCLITRKEAAEHIGLYLEAARQIVVPAIEDPTDTEIVVVGQEAPDESDSAS